MHFFAELIKEVLLTREENTRIEKTVYVTLFELLSLIRKLSLSNFEKTYIILFNSILAPFLCIRI